MAEGSGNSDAMPSIVPESALCEVMHHTVSKVIPEVEGV